MRCPWTLALLVAAVVANAAGFPVAAEAHGPVAPVALDYVARVTSLPRGLDAKVVDGDQRMWLRVPAGEMVVVRDYRGAPYLRFSRSGVEVNRSSAMYYLNQTPFAINPPANLGPQAPPRWQRVTGGHAYDWHDGRLHALATVALIPGVSFVGRWTIPILINGHAAVIAGGLWHANPPSIVWFWPIAVLLLCVLAAWRLKRPALDQRTARLLAVGALGAVAAAGIGRELHGRPAVSVLQRIELAIILAFVAWGLIRVVFRRPGYLSYFVIAMAALWEGLELIPTLLNGYVLIAVPAFVARAAAVLALGTGVGLLLLVFRLFAYREESADSSESREAPRSMDELDREGDSVWELT